jgi:predicted DNA binding CopG/RHH family protein
MKQKPVQYFSKEYIERCKGMTPEQILEFIDNFQKLVASSTKEKSKLISLKIEPSLLNAFRTKAELHNVPYQTQIKNLMKKWVLY